MQDQRDPMSSMPNSATAPSGTLSQDGPTLATGTRSGSGGSNSDTLTSGTATTNVSGTSSTTGRSGTASGTASGTKIVGKQHSEHGGPGPELMTADTLIGNEVANHQGETLGEIEDIMLDVPNGRVAYAVVSAGGFLGMGERLFAIPWQALKLDTENKCFLLDASKDRLKNAPGFDKDHWPSQAEQQWQTEVHSYYGTTPYW